MEEPNVAEKPSFPIDICGHFCWRTLLRCWNERLHSKDILEFNHRPLVFHELDYADARISTHRPCFSNRTTSIPKVGKFKTVQHLELLPEQKHNINTLPGHHADLIHSHILLDD